MSIINRTFDNLTLSNIKKLRRKGIGDKAWASLTLLLWASFLFVIAFLPLYWVGKVFVLMMYVVLGGICVDDVVGHICKRAK